MEAVRAQQDAILGEQRDGQGVDLDVVLVADGAGDHVALGPFKGLILGDLAAIDEHLDLGMVLRHAGELALPEAIDAAVAGPDAGIVILLDQQRGHR